MLFDLAVAMQQILSVLFAGDVWVSEYDPLRVMLTEYRCVYR